MTTYSMRAIPVAVAVLGLSFSGLAMAVKAKADLTDLSLEQLMDLRVVGASKYEQKQSEVAAAVSVITRDEIRKFGWRTIEQALASLPGIHTTYDRQYSYLGTRGFGVPGDFNTRVLVTINGNRLNDTLYDGGPMGRQLPLNMDLVERIEFVPGPGGAVYGQNAMFGVVNIVTRQGKDLNGVELAAGFEQLQRLRESRVTLGRQFDDGLHLLVSASTARSRGADPMMDFGAAGISGVATGLDGERDKELFIRAGKGGLSFDLAIGDHRKDDPTGAYLSDPLVPGQYQADRHAVAQLRFEGTWLDGTVHAQARAFSGKETYSSTLIYGTPITYPSSGNWRGAELRLVYTGIEAHKLMLGLEAQDHPQVVQRVLDAANPANDLVIRSPGWRAGAYVQDEWRVSPRWLATLGLRIDRDSASGTHSSPRAALIWQPQPQTTLKALYGRAHRAPNAYERDYGDGVALVANPSLKGERIDTLELVADHRVGTDLALRAAAYRWTMKGIVTLGIDTASGLPQYQSGGGVQAKGLELSADKTFAGGMRLRGSLSLQEAEHQAGSQLVNSPRTLFKLHLTSPLPLAGMRVGYELLVDGRRLALNGGHVPGYALSNLHLSATDWLKGVDLGLGVRNLFGRRYWHPGADTNWQNVLEQDGRSAYLSAQVRF